MGEKAAEDVKLSLEKFEDVLGDVDAALKPVLEVFRDKDELEKLSAADSARAHITLAYAANSLFYMYLRTQGMDPSQHPVREELERVKAAFVKLQKAFSPPGGGPAPNEKSKLNVEASARFIAASVDADKQTRNMIRKTGSEVEKRKKHKKRMKGAKSASHGHVR
eukprot:Plantae.Rhodophyta-Purpureofilum_apyrenoidigerum.ctg25518.p1 GENE.Plantae.Rhodophyta-Purpureofilum_apyrenoidigerum.ctg25518~~Plantae.Rhodophyta-Purpureofilum_apyrenoidigerum.ctg25518.p1  ORF type:complete len:174 (-),score=41.44 Plantae.Rhodophyta-Purpureofilum_apyrenoidigerum.ctg25518:406-900(-)